MTTDKLNIDNAGLFPINLMILATGLFYGCVAQVITFPRSNLKWTDATG